MQTLNWYTAKVDYACVIAQDKLFTLANEIWGEAEAQSHISKNNGDSLLLNLEGKTHEEKENSDWMSQKWDDLT